MTISLKKVSAGSGYDYLTRQVAAQDSTLKTGLAAYYEEKGEAPGVWMGSGVAELGQGTLAVGDTVTERQLMLLIGAGCDPVTGRQLGSVFQRFASAQSNIRP